MLQGKRNAMHLIQYDYEYSPNNMKKTSKSESNKKPLSYVQYRMFVDTLQDKVHNKYELRAKHNEDNQDIQPQVRKPSMRLCMDKIKELNNISKTKGVGEPSRIEREVKELEESFPSFKTEKKLSKIKILVPLMELARNPSYDKKIKKVIQPKGSTSPPDTVNLQDDSPTIVFGPHIDEKDEVVAPFYVTLNIHDKVLHNCMLDSRASQNIMPKVGMEKLGLEITISYHDLYFFDARKVKCYGLIKDMVVTLAQLLAKSIMMDVAVVDVLVNYGMLLFRTWARKLGGTI